MAVTYSNIASAMAPNAPSSGAGANLTATANQAALAIDLAWTLTNGPVSSVTIQRRVAGDSIWLSGPVRVNDANTNLSYRDNGSGFGNTFVGGTVYEYRLEIVVNDG